MSENRKALREVPGKGTVLSLKIMPRANASRFDGMIGDAIRVRIKAPPVDGKANEELIGFLSRVFRVSRSSVSILNGATSRNKKVLVMDYSPDQIAQIIAL